MSNDSPTSVHESAVEAAAEVLWQEANQAILPWQQIPDDERSVAHEIATKAIAAYMRGLAASVVRAAPDPPDLLDKRLDALLVERRAEDIARAIHYCQAEHWHRGAWNGEADEYKTALRSRARGLIELFDEQACVAVVEESPGRPEESGRATGTGGTEPGATATQPPTSGDSGSPAS